MANTCLITKLKSVVDKPDLEVFDTYTYSAKTNVDKWVKLPITYEPMGVSKFEILTPGIEIVEMTNFGNCKIGTKIDATHGTCPTETFDTYSSKNYPGFITNVQSGTTVEIAIHNIYALTRLEFNLIESNSLYVKLKDKLKYMNGIMHVNCSEIRPINADEWGKNMRDFLCFIVRRGSGYNKDFFIKNCKNVETFGIDNLEFTEPINFEDILVEWVKAGRTEKAIGNTKWGLGNMLINGVRGDTGLIGWTSDGENVYLNFKGNEYTIPLN